jgi:hypothetical protein
MRALHVLFLTIAVAGAALADEPNAPQVVAVPMPGGGMSMTYAVPTGSPVKFEKMEDYALARFAGRFRIEGAYRYGRLSNDPKDDAAYDVIELVFVPDGNYRAVLPYWHERGPVETLFIENEKDFVAAVIGPSLMSDIKSRKRLSVSGRAAIWVDRYTAAFDCDVPTYTVRFLKVDRPPTVVASNDLVQTGCL